MLPVVKGSVEKHLLGLDRIQAGMDQASREVSSGYRVDRPSDDPLAAAAIIEAHSAVARVAGAARNVDAVKAEINAAEGALQLSIRVMDRAAILAAEGSNSPTLVDRSALAEEVKGLLEQMVSLSRTSSGGGYVFSGDLNSKPLYEYVATPTAHAERLAVTASTRLVEGADGTVIAPARTAGDIFDARDAADQPAEGNVFAALQQLHQALVQDDGAAVAEAAKAVDAASSHLNRQLAYYGNVQKTVEQAAEIAARFTTQEQERLSGLRDADLTGAALRLSQSKVHQEAALAVAGRILERNLFDFLA